MNWLKKMMVCFFCAFAIVGCKSAEVVKSNQEMYQSLIKDGWIEFGGVESKDIGLVIAINDAGDEAIFYKYMGNDLQAAEMSFNTYIDGHFNICDYENKKIVDIDTNEVDDRMTNYAKKLLQKYDMSIDDMVAVLKWRYEYLKENANENTGE